MNQKRTRLVELAVNPGTPDARIDVALATLNGSQPQGRVHEEGFLGVKDAQNYLGKVSRVGLWRLRQRGLKSHRVGGRVVFLRQDLNEFVCNPARK